MHHHRDESSMIYAEYSTSQQHHQAAQQEMESAESSRFGGGGFAVPTTDMASQRGSQGTQPQKRDRPDSAESERRNDYNHSNHHHQHHRGGGGGGSSSSRHRSSRRRGRSSSKERKRRKEKSISPKCDEEGHLVVHMGSNLTERYKILDDIGVGTFGRVLECWDRKHRQRVAVKVVRNVSRYREGAEVEIDVLKKMHREAEKKLEWKHPCIKLLSSFNFGGHVCLSFPLYGLSLYDFIKKNRFRGFAPEIAREMIFQLFAAVAWMHDMELVHTDLKPENILFLNPSYAKDEAGLRVPESSEIVLIDFGSATFENDHHTTIVSTRHYRAPEVILGSGWSFPCDVWSLGCILCELLTGDVLFDTHENLEHLALMECVLGPIPSELVKSANRGKKYFNDGRLLWPVNASSDESIQTVKDAESLKEQFGGDPDCLSLLQGCLTYAKQDRLTALECLQHRYFDDVIRSKRFESFIPPAMREKLQRQRSGTVLLDSCVSSGTGSPLI